ncbi:haloacid dehalogenase type II [uncultured Methylibium sp.]|uniref:haloacid dehalogenase type II n=1 Tax=uncultured Methylibium sp. TaxID=381093 RepID=UPI0025CD6E08|nr:haloacid dehalogenase type II [uncultured Methylibium sp.]
MKSAGSLPPVQAVLFDAYGTLFDVYSVGTLAEQLFPGRGEALAVLWRDKQIEYTRLTSMSGRYRPFWDLTRAGLRYACARLKLELTAERESQLLNQYRHLGSFPENKAVLQALKARGVTTGILSNGDPDMLSVAVKSAGYVDDQGRSLLDHLISVETVQRYKTDPATYALGTQALGKPARQVLFVSSNCWDAIGATWFGYTTLWVNRGKLPLEALDTEPTRTGSSLRDVLDFFPAAS